VSARAWLIDRVAALCHEPAVRFEPTGELATWGELRDEGSALLGAAGVAAPGCRVGWFGHAPRTACAALLGALVRDATLVSLHPRLARPELEAQLRDAQLDALLTDAPALDPAAAAPCRVLVTGAGAPPGTAAPMLAPLADSSVPLLQLYTSGTTGAARGALLGADALLASARASTARLDTGPGDTWLACMPLAHIGGISILLRALVDGARVVSLPGFDAASTWQWLQAGGITRVSLVPTMLLRVLGQAGGAAPPPTLRSVLVGGAALDAALHLRALDAGWPVVTTYGLTEACSQVVTSPGVAPRSRVGWAGRPLDGIEVRIASPDAGGVGEVCVRGAVLMQGYWQRPAATAAALHDGWLLTGDLGQLDAEGWLRLVARRSDLIVTGGENVRPAEVEAVLEACPGVLEAAVVGLPDPVWGSCVAAAVVWQPGVDPTWEELERWCRARLAGFKLPRRWLAVEALPRTATGKVVRNGVVEAFARSGVGGGRGARGDGPDVEHGDAHRQPLKPGG
jgi:O-succinylbenzoic acid--CoA ligase